MPHPTPSFREAVNAWTKIACLSFGGPASQIAVMHRVLVEEKKWLSEGQFLHALNYCMLLPGPEAQQLVTYSGWLLHGTLGGLTAGLLFVLPGFLSILTLSLIYITQGHLPAVDAAFFGLRAAVLAVVIEALIRVSKKALKNHPMRLIAVLAFFGIFFFNIPFPVIIFLAGLIGYWGGRLYPDIFYVIKEHKVEDGSIQKSRYPTIQSTLKTAAMWLAIWLIPVFGLIALLGKQHILSQLAIFFSQTSMVTFGGAYSVLTYVAQKAVQYYGWLSPAEMLTGLSMAETTPGPLIQVLQFVGFVAAYRDPHPFSPMMAALLGSVVTTWVTYAPCFLWIFTGAPYIEHLRGNKNLNCALSGITAAVVGVILNLSVWFALHVIFTQLEIKHVGPLLLHIPNVSSLDTNALCIALFSSVMVLGLKRNLIVVLALSALAGIILKTWL